MKKLFTNALWRYRLIGTLLGFLSIVNVYAQYPPGFSRVTVAEGLNQPIVMDFAPDGRLFIGQQGGAVRIIKNGALLPTPFCTIDVHYTQERGLIGIVLDPDFASNGYVYLCYSKPDGSTNSIARYTANGDVAIPGSRVDLVDLGPLNTYAWIHNGGAMKFGVDGKLYVATGDNVFHDMPQNLDSFHGKILRFNKDGSPAEGNPYPTGSLARRSIWASGFRNPFTFDIDPITGKIYVNDVGGDREEINDVTLPGGNYGWPALSGVSTNPAYTNPIYDYASVSRGGNINEGCAITGGAFFRPTTTNYPSDYYGKYFFFDWCSNWINYLDIETNERFNFSTGGAGLSLDVSPDGELYYLQQSGGVYKITYTSNNSPAISNHPANVTVPAGQAASFTISATGSQPMTYQWQRNGVNIPGATSSTYSIAATTTSDAGQFRVVVSNAFGSATSNTATLTVTSFNAPPTATITTPTSGTFFRAGDVINFSGVATDPEDGVLPASAFEWWVHFHHNTHYHPGPTVSNGVRTGSFETGTQGETEATVWYRLYLRVTDSQGLQNTTYVDIDPLTSIISMATQPSGLTITLDGNEITAPYSVASVENISRSIGVVSPQQLNGKTYEFSGWSHGGQATQTISTPIDDVTYTAIFTEVTVGNTVTLPATKDAYVRGGEFSDNLYGAHDNHKLLTKFSNGTPGFDREVFLGFDLTSINSTIISASLELYNSAGPGSATTVDMFPVANTTWGENTINWNNKPAAGNTLVASTTTTGAPGYYSWNITDYINNERAAGRNAISLLMKNRTVTGPFLDWNAKEFGENPPRLVITTGGGTNPSTSVITLATQPSGLQVTMGGNEFTAPYSVVSIEGTERTIGVVSPQQLNGKTYEFSAWSHGGQATQTISTPADDITYTAIFTEVTGVNTVTLPATKDAYVRGGEFSDNLYGAHDTHKLLTKFSNGNPGFDREVFLGFDLSSVSGSIVSASLELYNSAGPATATTVDMFPVANTTWGENTINWNNKPAAGNTLVASTTTTGAPGYYSWNITDYINSEKAAGRDLISLQMKNRTVTGPFLDWNAKEFGENPPRLVIITGGSTNPTMSVVTLATQPLGLQVTMGGNEFTAPYSVVSVEGTERTIGVLSPQQLNGKTYEFAGWSHGGEATQTITTPADDITYTAVFTELTGGNTITLAATKDAYVRGGEFSDNLYGAHDSQKLLTKFSNGNLAFDRDVFLGFDLSSVSEPIVSASLELYNSAGPTTATTVDMFPVANTTWGENTINWNNRPEAGNTIVASTTTTGAPGYYSWNITDYINSEKAAGRNAISLLMKNRTVTGPFLDWNAKEFGENPPRLVITTGTTNTVQLPYNLVPSPIPGKIEAEHYDLGGSGIAYFDLTEGNIMGMFRDDDVDIEATYDEGDAFVVSWIAEGEWLEYSVNVLETGLFSLDARVASPGTGSFNVEMDGVVIATVQVPTTGGWAEWQTVTISDIQLSQGPKTMRIFMNTGGFNINYVNFRNNDAPIHTPYGGVACVIPGIIEAEHYDEGGQGFAYYDTDAGNSGGAFRNESVDIENCKDINNGYNIGWIREGEWLLYTVDVAATGIYTLNARVASPAKDKFFHVEMDGNTIATVYVPETGDWQNWTTVSVPNISLTQGRKVMRIFMDTYDFNLNYVSFESSNAVTARSASESSLGLRAFKIYPNPANDNVTVGFESQSASNVKITLVSMLGETKVSENISSKPGWQEVVLDINDVTSGIYILMLESDGVLKSKTLVIE